MNSSVEWVKRFLQLGRDDLREYQWLGHKLITDFELPGALIALDPGMGKTIITLTAIRDLIDWGEVEQVLIVAPLLVAEETWPYEIEDWSHTEGLTYEVITGSEARRVKRANIKSNIHLINKENIPWLVEYWGTDWPYDMLVVDESSCFRNHKKRNKPTKAATLAYAKDPVNVPKPKSTITRFGHLCRVRKYLKRTVLLTGTPAPNGLTDLWSQLYLIDGGDRLGEEFYRFQRRYFSPDRSGFKWIPTEGALGFITEKIQDVTLSLREDDWLELPERLDRVVKLTMPEAVAKKYKRFQRTMVYEEHDVEAVNNGVLAQKLLQLASGGLYDEEGNAHRVHDLKLHALDSIIEEATGPVFVAYNYEFDQYRLRGRYKGAEFLGEEKNQVARWNAGKIPVLFAHPASASFGLNLQKGGNIAVWYSLPWSLEHYIQWNARLLRSGQEAAHVILYHLVVRGTVDEKIMRVLPEKAATQDELLNAVAPRKLDLAA